MGKQTGDEKAKSKGLWLYPGENKALKDLAKRWKLKESRVVARLISEANPDARAAGDIGASVSAIASGLGRVEARLARLEELLVAGCSLPSRDMRRLGEAQTAKNEAEATTPVEAASTVDDGTEDQGYPPYQEFAKLKACVAEAFERTGIGPRGKFVSGKRQEPELKRVLESIGAMPDDAEIQLAGQRAQASLVLRSCLLYALTFEMDDDQTLALDRLATLGFPLDRPEVGSGLYSLVIEQLGTQG